MGVPTSEVGYTSAMPRREDHEVRKGHVGHWIKKKTAEFLNVTGGRDGQWRSVPQPVGQSKQRITAQERCGHEQVHLNTECMVPERERTVSVPILLNLP